MFLLHLKDICYVQELFQKKIVKRKIRMPPVVTSDQFQIFHLKKAEEKKDSRRTERRMKKKTTKKS